MEREVIASACLCNTASLNIYEATDEYVVVGINEYNPTTHKLYWTNKGAYFNWGTWRKHRYYLSEFMRV